VARRGRGDEGNDAYLAPAQRAAQRQNLVDARQEQRPEDARGRALGGIPSWQRCGRERGCRPRQGSDLRALGRIGRQHAVVAVAVQAWGRDQCGQALDQLQGRQPQLGAPIGLGLGEAIDELVVSDLLEALQGEGGRAQ
jgi:hypothetical protein